MAFIMNEWDVENAVHAMQTYRSGTGWDIAADKLQRYVDWVNSVSDGWPYWSAGSNAARKLQEALQGELDSLRRGFGTIDLDPDSLNKLLRSIKSCITRNGGDWREVLG